MHVRIIEGCIVCRQCECRAPDVFAVDEKAHTARVVDPAPRQDREPDIIQAVKDCPVHVIKLRRDRRRPPEAGATHAASRFLSQPADQPINTTGHAPSAVLSAVAARPKTGSQP